MKLLVSILLCVSTSAVAWSPITGYPEKLYSLAGDKTESSGPFKPHVELAYAPKTKQFAISFYGRTKADQGFIVDAEVTIFACKQRVAGFLKEDNFYMTPYEKSKFTNILSNCNQALFIRVYDNMTGTYGQYRFNNSEKISFKDIS